MIDHKLAKELKDAGFPQTDTTAFYWYKAGDVPILLHDSQVEYDEGILCAAPTLSELIVACGGKMDMLEAHNDSTLWVARSVRWDNTPHQQHGSTPEEAVARLYLAITNPKS